MTDQTIVVSKKSENTSVVIRGFSTVLAGFITSYILNRLSLHGVDFKTLGVDSELVKSFIDGTIAGAVAAPKNLVHSLIDAIIFVRDSFASVWEAIRYGKPYQGD